MLVIGYVGSAISEIKMTVKGKFIVFEGIDGSGKSTQLHFVHDYLRSKGHSVYVTTEPTDRPIGLLIRKVLQNELTVSEETLAALFVADRLDHIQNEVDGMAAKLDEGVHVLSDRYYWSSYAYHGLHLPIDQVVAMNDICHQLLSPDITLYLDLTAEQSIQRIVARNEQKEKFEKLELLQKIRQNYLLAFRNHHQELPVEVIDASQSVEACTTAVQLIIDKYFIN